jgi:hypothetical protein
MHPGELIAAESSPGDDYPNLDELLRKLHSRAAGFYVVNSQTKILPVLWKMLRGVRDQQGEFYSSLHVREVAYNVSYDLTRLHYKNEGLGDVMPDVVTLAGAKSRTIQPAHEPEAADFLESDPCTEMS